MPVVDASVVVDWVAPGIDDNGPARRLLTRLAAAAAPLYAPPLLLAEVGNALLTGVRRERWSADAADAAFQLLESLPVVIDHREEDVRRAWDLSRRFDEHPIYDMLYLAMAERRGDTLITADDRMRERVRRPHVIAPDDWSHD